MSPHLDAFVDAGFDKELLARVLLCERQTLSYSLDGKLQPVLAALEGVLGSPQAVVEAVSKAPSLLGMSLCTLDSNLKFLRGLGLTDSEIGDTVSRQPQLFYRDYTSAEFQTKLRYFEVVLGRCPRDMLLQHPAYLKSGLHLIDYRVSALPGDAQSYPCLRPGGLVPHCQSMRLSWSRCPAVLQKGK